MLCAGRVTALIGQKPRSGFSETGWNVIELKEIISKLTEPKNFVASF